MRTSFIIALLAATAAIVPASAYARDADRQDRDGGRGGEQRQARPDFQRPQQQPAQQPQPRVERPANNGGGWSGGGDRGGRGGGWQGRQQQQPQVQGSRNLSARSSTRRRSAATAPMMAVPMSGAEGRWPPGFPRREPW